MPPKCKFTRDEIISAVLNITRRNGYDSVTARSVAAELGSSPKVIFSAFESMDELHKETIAAADMLYMQYIAEDIASGKFPPYKASGMAYIRFAKEETELFKLRFMRDRSHEAYTDETAAIEPIIVMIQQTLGLSREMALEMHLQMWIYVHGIASMIATNYLNFDMAEVSRLISESYYGLQAQYTAKQASKEVNNNVRTRHTFTYEEI